MSLLNAKTINKVDSNYNRTVCKIQMGVHTAEESENVRKKLCDALDNVLYL